MRARQLWVADRNFCAIKFPAGLAAAGAAFLIRQQGQLVGQPQGQPRRVGATATGVALEQPFHVPRADGRALELRRVRVQLHPPTRDGDRELLLLTNRPAAAADALAVAEQYRRRGRIEAVMQRLAEVLRRAIKPLCCPKAASFGFALALVLYNALTVVLAAHGAATRAALSHYYLALEIAQASDGLLVALPECWAAAAGWSPAALAQALRRIAQGLEPSCYAKSRRGPKKPKPKPKHARRKVHVSTKKLLDQRKQ